MSIKKTLKIFLFSLFLSSRLFSSSVQLLDLFQKASEGDYVVFEQQKQLTLFRVAKKKGRSLTIEEITCALKDKPHSSWQAWLEAKAPNSTSWTLSSFQQDGDLESIFSVTTEQWIEKEKTFAFLSTLFQLQLDPIKEALLKRIGPPPEAGELDRRKIWMPKIFVAGHELATTCSVYQTRWPQDETELSGTLLHIYIPKSKEALDYFPYLIEAIGKISRVKLRVIDSGRGLTSPVQLPKNSSF
jgi:hypothetical protein